jgi:hypothetical protein
VVAKARQPVGTNRYGPPQVRDPKRQMRAMARQGLKPAAIGRVLECEEADVRKVLEEAQS